jgi:hypothetical protein
VLGDLYTPWARVLAPSTSKLSLKKNGFGPKVDQIIDVLAGRKFENRIGKIPDLTLIINFRADLLADTSELVPLTRDYSSK